MAEQLFANARIVTADRIVQGHLMTADGVIRAVENGSTALPAHDCGGDYLLPGLVELHTDNLEWHATPRPNAVWPMRPAVQAHDAQVAAAGITTVLDAVALGDILSDSFRVQNLAAMVDGVAEAAAAGVLRADHYIHLRCELCFPDLIGLFEQVIDRPGVRLASVMDHTPGQRQFLSMEKYASYFQAKLGMTDEAFAGFVAERRQDQARYAGPHRRHVVEACAARGIPVASHDDATAAHVAEAVADGMTIAEFPTTTEAAAASKAGGMAVMMGAPNMIRGGSHSGNASAKALAERGLVDILSSDYLPASLLPAAFKLAAEVEAITLPDAIRTVSLEPARRAGLTDRGEIAPGKRADLVQVRETVIGPAVIAAWRAGERVL